PAGVGLTRASPATRITPAGSIEELAADQPRFDHDPVTGAPLGLLAEPAAQNLVHEAVAGTGGWSALNATLTDLALGAMGLFPGLQVASGGANWHRAQVVTGAWNAGAPLRLSVWYVAGSSGEIMVNIRNVTAGVESVATGAAGAVAPLSAGAGPITDVANLTLAGGVQKVEMTFTPDAAAAEGRLGVGPNSTVVGEDVVVLGAQIEEGSAATSLILSAGGPGSRAADVVTLERWSGTHDIEITHADGSMQTRSAVALAPGHVLSPFAETRVKELRIL
ncbi:MAG: hypothetical protein D6811_06090, partial [Alphaproteobacteria bacterium]